MYDSVITDAFYSVQPGETIFNDLLKILTGTR